MKFEALPIMSLDEPLTDDDDVDILIVDDTVNNLKLLADMLTLSGFKVRKAVSGAIALKTVQAKLPALILLDISMPDMDGYEVCRHLKENPETEPIPIIFLSALDAAFDKIKAFDLGAADYITKPFQQGEVLKRIQNQLRIRTLTQELEHQNQSLEKALKYLKENQSQLIQREKMLGLSQLISGMAHEINNPISFISGNIGHAKDYFEKLRDVIQTYRLRYPHDQIMNHISDVDFIFEDFPNLLHSMDAGTIRICDIIKALQTFSHHQKEGVKEINLHLTLDSILVLLQARLRGRGDRPSIEVNRQYGKLPPVTCDAKLTGQVFLNLLNNAIDAIDELWNLEEMPDADVHLLEREPQITVSTDSIHDERVKIAIADNGIGISEQAKSRVYEPFFSTKPVGSGNGLGLSMSYQIVTEAQQGKLYFTSTSLQGSQFVVELPVAPQS